LETKLKLNVEQRIYMDKFKPRPYQLDFVVSMENKGVKKAVAIWPRRKPDPEKTFVPGTY